MQSHTATNSAAGPQACAVCKYQRRKCTNNCLLAPFFPANRHKDFLNTRKLFGVRNIIKLIENLNFQQRVIAIRTIIFEANMRAQNPVGGCYGLICDLNNKIGEYKTQLNLVNQQLAIYKSQSVFTQYQQQQPQKQYNDGGDQNLDAGFSIFDGGGGGSSPPLLSAYDVFESNLVKAELEGSNVLSDVDEDMKPLFGNNKRDQSFSFDSEGHVVFSDDKKEQQTFCFDSGGSKIQNSGQHVSKERGGLIQHQLKNDLNGGASLFTLTSGKE
ncbi:LOB domain-containing protein 22 isoform X1 [Gossypium raimondii]|uniref:LOB domain-containing protein n=1 Tax=Gossypium raimondii TaxID=29730 RepID=A0A0D2LTN9_GOSRA|nr:LOB domain-containing protein 22 isoform X1 [Gossypium raimondii]KJB07412.1 hypothetical protein B456_001G022100 [Gossypium raimondii]MBA0578070.1 hypothetical protein [Gossypium raimondii]